MLFSLAPQLLAPSWNTASSREWAALSIMNTRQSWSRLLGFWTVSKQLTIHGSHLLPISLAALGRADRDLSAYFSLHDPALRAADLGRRPPLSHVRRKRNHYSSCWPHCLCYLCTPLALIAPTNIPNWRHLMWETLLFIVWLYQSVHSQSLEPNQGQLLVVDNLQARKECCILFVWKKNSEQYCMQDSWQWVLRNSNFNIHK